MFNRTRLALCFLLYLFSIAPAIPTLNHVVERQQANPIPLAPPELNVNFGAEKKLGRFMPDMYPWLVGGTKATDRFNKADAVIGGADKKNEVMYKSHRYGKPSFGEKPWGYDIPVQEPGLYNCTVHFAETANQGFKVGARVFDLTIEGDGGKPVQFNNIDVYAKTGKAMFVVHTETAPLIVVKRFIKVRVSKKPQSQLGAFMAGLTCIIAGDLPKGVKPPAPPQNAYSPPVTKYAAIGQTFPGGPVIKGTTLNLNCGGGKVGRFLADQTAYLHYGPTTIFSKPGHPIGGAEPNNLPALRDSRYGLGKGASWGYQIPMGSPGEWQCTLHFSELVETMKPGSRVFHIQVQDQQMDNVDITKGTKGAIFTSYTRTFDVVVADVLVVRLYRVKGDPSVNALTCERKKAMTLTDAQSLLSARAVSNGVKPPPKRPPPAAPSKPAPQEPAQPPVDNSTTSVSPGNATVPVSPVPTPVTDANKTRVIVPVTNTSPDPSVIPPKPSPSASNTIVILPSTAPVEPVVSPNATVAAPNDTSVTQNDTDPTVEVTPSPMDLVVLQDIQSDPAPTAGEGQTNVAFALRIVMPNGTEVNNTLKEQVKEVFADGGRTNDTSLYALTEMSTSGVATKAIIQQDTQLEATVIATFQTDLQEAITDQTQTYISEGKATTALQEKGCVGCTMALASAPTVQTAGEVPGAKAPAGVGASTIVAAVVGSVLGALLIVALIAFFVIQRHRRNEMNPASFDAPPPAEMEDSDGEAPSSSAHSESERSVDYLDDDSTFTAATSRQGDPEAGVTLDKDVWGRGSS